MGLLPLFVNQFLARHDPPSKPNPLFGEGVRAVHERSDYAGRGAEYDAAIRETLSQPFMLPPSIESTTEWFIGNADFWQQVRLPTDNGTILHFDATDICRGIVEREASSFAELAQCFVDCVATAFTRSPFVHTVGIYFDDTERNWPRAYTNFVRVSDAHQPAEDRARYRRELFDQLNLYGEDVGEAMAIIESTLPPLTGLQQEFIERMEASDECLGEIIASLDADTPYVASGVKTWFTDTRTRLALVQLFARILTDPECAHAMFAGYSWYPGRPWPAIFFSSVRNLSGNGHQDVIVSAYPRAETPDAAAYPDTARPVFRLFPTASLFRMRGAAPDSPPAFRYMCESDFNLCTMAVHASHSYGLSNVVWSQDSDTMTVLLNLLEQLQVFPASDVLSHVPGRQMTTVANRAVAEWPHLRSGIDRTRIAPIIWVRNTSARCTVVDMFDAYHHLYVNIRVHYAEWLSRPNRPADAVAPDSEEVLQTLQMPALLTAFVSCEGCDYVPHRSSIVTDVINRAMRFIDAGGVGFMRDPAGSGLYHPYCHSNLFTDGMDGACLVDILRGQYMFSVAYYLSACNHMVPVCKMAIDWPLPGIDGSSGAPATLRDVYQFDHYTHSEIVKGVKKNTVQTCNATDPARARHLETLIDMHRLRFMVFSGRKHYELVAASAATTPGGSHPLDGVDYGIVDLRTRPLIVHPAELSPLYYGVPASTEPAESAEHTSVQAEPVTKPTLKRERDESLHETLAPREAPAEGAYQAPLPFEPKFARTLSAKKQYEQLFA